MKTSTGMSGWRRLFVVAAVLWAIAAAVWTLNLRMAQSQEIFDRQLTRVQAMCYGVEKATATVQDREQCRVAREATVDSEIASWPMYGVVFVTVWLLPLGVLLGLIATGRWVARGFRRQQ
ncbi:MAG TPA: hypothetical protein VHC92_05080 [Rhodanobacteraceae bacterium]|nr:hypothetical protein [Rhodanobacteraceae bacterium]